jgi:hypothetical protein
MLERHHRIPANPRRYRKNPGSYPTAVHRADNRRLEGDEDMPTIRSSAELETLSAEAERRVRAGESRADVALALDVPLSTMTDWARKGRWLRRDLDIENAPHAARLVAERIARIRAQDEARRAARPCRDTPSAATAATGVGVGVGGGCGDGCGDASRLASPSSTLSVWTAP